MTPTAKQVRAALDYDPATGVFTWRKRDDVPARWNVRYAGTVAGGFKSAGSWQIALSGAVFMAHRLAWLVTTGAWPADQIDHINGDKGDNRLINLRETTRSKCQHKAGVRRDNTSGFKGVIRDTTRGMWRAQISIDGRFLHLGYFVTPEAAHAAYCEAAAEHHGTFAHG